jgi:hypothetical protein
MATFRIGIRDEGELPHPQVFPARDQGKSPPRLHKARVGVTRTNAHHNMDTLSPL